VVTIESVEGINSFSSTTGAVCGGGLIDFGLTAVFC
jgi:hypothetical protein